ncbi:ribose 5-phosphate isomerase B [Alkaliphilus pronyensis]|uniref:Ribose 5-phosphate isomerase B n=1 Tax=Alkaliphilus pronyensis TaxID=1482732 RepID=A0A6I0FMT3_9FIRM|nr:ribose 5-phosphate isomerase B [Alkaliphilus pronyensis]KAB3539718.1 ribose 5-phosphate isomerase B [Alkaliphilus pronyensis]
MKIAIGSDHGGYELKKIIKKHLQGKAIKLKDFGTNTTDSCDYPDFALAVAEAVANGDYDRGVLICGTGIGISIAANKVPGIRCALVSDCFSAKATRQHNDTNVLALGGRVLGQGLALEILDTWLSTEFEGGRHSRRVDLISQIEKKYCKGNE